MYLADSITIIDKIHVNDDIVGIKLKRDSNLQLKPGQFVNIKPSDSDYPLLRRPISIAEFDTESYTLYIKKIGVGTNSICDKEIGESLNILAPLGNGFDINKCDKRALVIGAGIGVAPLIQLVKELRASNEELIIDVILGYKDTPYLNDLYKGYVSSITLVSEIAGYDFKGYISDAVDEKAIHVYDSAYVCGPHIAMKKVNQILLEKGINPQLLMEEKMACGFGACLVCACKIAKGDDYIYKKTCKDGPVFHGKEVIFDEE